MSIELKNLSKNYIEPHSNKLINIIAQINCCLEKGRFLSIIGPSGCGKTTLLRMIAGLDTASKGQILLDGDLLEGPDQRIGMVFQEYALFPWRTALKNIEMGMEIKGIEPELRTSEAMSYIQAFGLTGFENKYPKELSGGMKQRVAIARTLITNPQVVLMDEPFGSLDSQTRNTLQDFLLGVWVKRRDTVLFVTHNVDEAVYMSDCIMVLSPRPSSIMAMLNVSLPRPRDRTSPELNHIRKQILDLLHTTRT